MGLAISPIAPEPLAGERVADTIARANGDGRDFTIVEGLSDALVEKLTKLSQDESDTELMQNTSDRTRFSPDAYDAWLSKERYPFALVAEDGSLAALIWYGPEEMPTGGAGDTIAFRSYPPYRGRGVMTDFSRFVMELHEKRRAEHQLWLATDAENVAGIRLYEKLGFVRHGEEDDRLFMVLP